MADLETSDQGSRCMPEFVKRGLIRVSGGTLYLKASHRILWMRSEHEDWSVVTSIEYADWEKGFVVVRAVIMDGEGRILATAHAEETRGKLPYLRKAETASVARALALCGYGTQFGEMEDDAEAVADTADPMAGKTNGAAEGVWSGPGACPSCRAPAGKKHASGCKS